MFKKHKKISLLGMLVLALIMLSGCSQTTSTAKPTGFPYGFIYNYLAVPGQAVMAWIAKFVGGYGWALIVLTVIVRLLLLPLMTNQMKKTTIQQEKMNLIKPQLTKIQEFQKTHSSQEDRIKASQAMMSLYRENGVSMTGGIGCLPMLIQLPIFAALYEAIRYSNELSKTYFMGIQLGKPDLVLAILAFISYLIQAWLSLRGIPEEQSKTMKPMLLISPIMILVISISAPAGLGIYFFIGGVFACLQTLIINLYRPKIRREVEANAKQNPPKEINLDFTNVDNENHSEQATQSNETTHPESDSLDAKNRQRNAGKQNRK